MERWLNTISATRLPMSPATTTAGVTDRSNSLAMTNATVALPTGSGCRPASSGTTSDSLLLSRDALDSSLRSMYM